MRQDGVDAPDEEGDDGEVREDGDEEDFALEGPGGGVERGNVDVFLGELGEKGEEGG